MQPEDHSNILVVDDRPENLVAMEAILAPLGATVSRASSGSEALKLLLDREFAIILLDVMMPEMDGLETATLIRQRDGSQHTTIIFVTALSPDHALVLAGYRLGAVDFAFKPIDADILRMKVSGFLELHRLRQRERAHDQDLRVLLANNADGMLVLDLSGAIRYVNAAAEQLLNRSARELIGAPFGHPPAVDAIVELDLLRPDGEPSVVEMRTVPIHWANEPAQLALLHDVTKHIALSHELRSAKAQLESANAELYDTSIRDELSGLLNRRGLETELWSEIARVRRYGGSLTALVIDCDRFKDINTTHGYVGGDNALKEIARRLARNTRTTDVVSRIGGDEFLVLLPETREAEGYIVAEKLRRCVSSEPIASEACKFAATVSIGVAAVPKTASSLEDILVITRDLLQHSKDTGRNRVLTASGILNEVPTVQQALSDGYFRLLWQPIVALQSDQVVAHESFCKERVESPVDIFRIAHYAKQLSALDLHCLRLSAEKSKARGPGLYHCTLFPSTLLETPAEAIAAVLDGAADVKFCIELNEEDIVGSPSVLGRPVAVLRESGVRLSLRASSFGCRSLEALISLAPAFIRIHRGFLGTPCDMACKKRDLSRLFNIGKALSADIIAADVDDEADAELLKEVGVQYAQGSLFGGLLDA